MTPRWPELLNQPVLVLGLGASGMAMARWCARLGAQVTVADTRAEPPMASQLVNDLPQVQRVHASFDATLAQQQPWALVVRSPGIAPADMQGLSAVLAASNTPCVGELELFAAGLHAQQMANENPWPCAPVLAITGTNGKTTTTALTAFLLEQAGWDVAVAGNIGPNLLDVLSERIQVGKAPQAWVLELSSFQLDGVQGFEPSAATVLNLTQDHLDWHGSMEAYAQAKAHIFGQQGLMVLNRNDEWVMRNQPATERIKNGVRFKTQVRPYVTFGADVPAHGGDWGLETVNGMTWLVRAVPADDMQAPVRQPEGATDEWVLQRLMPAEALRIRGRHNACNALAALALATSTGAPMAPMLHALREYKGEPHRVEPVAIVNEVEFIDDSKGTNVGATLAAIEGLGVDRPLWLILGGEGKGQDFAPLMPAVRQYVKGVALIGRDAHLIQEAITSSQVQLHHADSMQAAVQWCAAQARPGHVVMLSPACASFDMFRDYAHRAQVFVEAVQALALDQGSLT
jgi:UDP-N-acetylmuramoylalanine--D-glutamate ligase